MFTLNRIISLKGSFNFAKFSIEHCNKLSTEWRLECVDEIGILQNNFEDEEYPPDISLYQESKEVKFDLGVILELVTSNGIVVNRSKFTVIPANCVETEEKRILRCELLTNKFAIDESIVIGLPEGRAILFTRDPEGSSKILPETLSLHSSYKILFNDKESADIVVKASDEVELRVHKFPLMTRSSTFKAMFGIDMTEKQTGIVHISDFDSKVLTELFRFIYYNEVEDIEEIVVELIKAAKRYEVDVLPEICAKSIINNFQDLEIWNVLKLAHVYELQELFEFVASIFLANYEIYSQQEVWKKEQDISLKLKVHERFTQFHLKYKKSSGICMEF